MSDGDRTRDFQCHRLAPASESLGENDGSAERANTGANSGAVEGPAPAVATDPELVVVVEAWGSLPAALRAGIVAMVRASTGDI